MHAAGGVACNQLVRRQLQALASSSGVELIVPPQRLCTDNGVMVAWAGIERCAHIVLPVQEWQLQVLPVQRLLASAASNSMCCWPQLAGHPFALTARLSEHNSRASHLVPTCCRLRLGLYETVPPDEDPALPVDVWPRWPLTHRY